MESTIKDGYYKAEMNNGTVKYCKVVGIRSLTIRDIEGIEEITKDFHFNFKTCKKVEEITKKDFYQQFERVINGFKEI